jgi:hypothetical protein
MWTQDPLYGVASLNGIADINQQGTLKLETKIYNKTGTLSFISYNSSSNSSIINVNGGGDTDAVYDAYTVIDSNNNNYYVNYILSSTSMELEGDATSIGTGNWKYKQPPYIDLNSNIAFDEKGISFSTNNAWEWALYEPHSQTERLCFANSINPLTEIMCIHENGNVDILQNITADYINAKIDASNIQNALWLTNYNETDPIFTAENTTIWNAINNKLNANDQRYNDTALINAVNTTNNIQNLGFNTATQDYANDTASFYPLQNNPAGYLKNSTSPTTITILDNVTGRTLYTLPPNMTSVLILQTVQKQNITGANPISQTLQEYAIMGNTIFVNSLTAGSVTGVTITKQIINNSLTIGYNSTYTNHNGTYSYIVMSMW